MAASTSSNQDPALAALQTLHAVVQERDIYKAEVEDLRSRLAEAEERIRELTNIDEEMDDKENLDSNRQRDRIPMSDSATPENDPTDARLPFQQTAERSNVAARMKRNQRGVRAAKAPFTPHDFNRKATLEDRRKETDCTVKRLGCSRGYGADRFDEIDLQTRKAHLQLMKQGHAGEVFGVGSS